MLAVGDVAGEWRNAPRRGAERHHIGMAGQAERLAGSAAADPRDQIGAASVPVQRMIGDAEARPLQDAAKIFGTWRFIAGRIDGLEADQVARQFDGINHLAAQVRNSGRPR